MDPVHNYLLNAYAKVIAHYRQVLDSSSLQSLERERILRGLAQVELELKSISDKLA